MLIPTKRAIQSNKCKYVIGMQVCYTKRAMVFFFISRMTYSNDFLLLSYRNAIEKTKFSLKIQNLLKVILAL